MLSPHAKKCRPPSILSREKSWAIGTAVNARPVRLQRCTTPGYITDPARRGKDPPHRSSPLPALPGCQHCPVPKELTLLNPAPAHRLPSGVCTAQCQGGCTSLALSLHLSVLPSAKVAGLPSGRSPAPARLLPTVVCTAKCQGDCTSSALHVSSPQFSALPALQVSCPQLSGCPVSR